jgi:hypothetical protein
MERAQKRRWRATVLGGILLSMVAFRTRGEADDDGADARNPNVHDQVHAIGAHLGYAIPRRRLGIAMKYLYEYYAEDRFRGHALTWSFGYKF